MEDDKKENTPEKVHCPVTPYDWLRTTYRTVTVCNISDIYPVMGMVSMCSIPHHTPRQRKGWTTACKPSSSLFSCYSFQPYILIVHGVWTHFFSPISLLFLGYGHIFPALYPHCSWGMDSFFQRHILIVPVPYTHCSRGMASLFLGYGLIVWFGQGFLLPCRLTAVNAASRWR
mgnify:CR=1 FL=1